MFLKHMLLSMVVSTLLGSQNVFRHFRNYVDPPTRSTLKKGLGLKEIERNFVPACRVEHIC